jgi:hypothetical protein
MHGDLVVTPPSVVHAERVIKRLFERHAGVGLDFVGVWW